MLFSFRQSLCGKPSDAITACRSASSFESGVEKSRFAVSVLHMALGVPSYVTLTKSYGVKSGLEVNRSDRSDAARSYWFNGGIPNTRSTVLKMAERFECPLPTYSCFTQGL